jgi:TRAP-type mannitol/chloroaromatic compound transport system permease small subunit
MSALLGLSRGIDALNGAIGKLCAVLCLAAALISAGNAFWRYLFRDSSNGLLEIQWYLFSGMFLLAAAYTLLKNEHVRVDVIYGGLSERKKLWLDLICTILFLMPFAALMTYWCYQYLFLPAWLGDEQSSAPGGLVRWPVKLLPVIGFALLLLQALSEAIKHVAAIHGDIHIDTAYEKPVQ